MYNELSFVEVIDKIASLWDSFSDDEKMKIARFMTGSED